MKLKSHQSEGSGWKGREWSGKGLEVMWWPGFDHGEAFETKESRAKLVGVLVEYSWDRS